jgi:hypothetical protein
MCPLRIVEICKRTITKNVILSAVIYLVKSVIGSEEAKKKLRAIYSTIKQHSLHKN